MGKQYVTVKTASKAPRSGQYEVIGPRAGSSDGYVVREASSGRFLEVRGAGSMKNAKFEIDREIDLNKPIAKQALTRRPTKKK